MAGAGAGAWERNGTVARARAPAPVTCRVYPGLQPFLSRPAEVSKHRLGRLSIGTRACESLVNGVKAQTQMPGQPTAPCPLTPHPTPLTPHTRSPMQLTHLAISALKRSQRMSQLHPPTKALPSVPSPRRARQMHKRMGFAGMKRPLGGWQGAHQTQFHRSPRGLSGLGQGGNGFTSPDPDPAPLTQRTPNSANNAPAAPSSRFKRRLGLVIGQG